MRRFFDILLGKPFFESELTPECGLYQDKYDYWVSGPTAEFWESREFAEPNWGHYFNNAPLFSSVDKSHISYG